MNKTVLMLAILAAVSSGCLGRGKRTRYARKARVAGAPAPTLERRYRVSADSTVFYHYGPQQPNGPDLSLKKGRT